VGDLKKEAWRFLRWLVAQPQAALYWDTLRVAPPADLRVLASPAFRSTRGIPSLNTAIFDVPPMTEARFPARAQWLLYATTPHPATGRPPGFILMHPRMSELQSEIRSMLNEYLAPASTLDARDALKRAVDAVHRVIDRDRAARGLPPVVRK
jgi:ABC-type glycerol-3-phosphate transport system substrate-binding protein